MRWVKMLWVAAVLATIGLSGCDTGEVDRTPTTTTTDDGVVEPADDAADNSTMPPPAGDAASQPDSSDTTDPAVREEPVEQVPEKLKEEETSPK